MTQVPMTRETHAHIARRGITAVGSAAAAECSEVPGKKVRPRH
ncbi:hypothetical protein ACH5A2_21585 [Streptomyces collinus]